MALKADPTTTQVKAKADKIAEIRAKLEAADAALLTEYRGLSVTDLAALRGVLRPANTEYKVYKNTLVRRAADELGLGDEVAAMLAGPVAIAFVSGDAAAAAKALREYGKTREQLVLKGGLLGTRPLDVSDIEALAELPTRDVLLSQIAGLFEAPLAQTASVLEALLRDTVGLVRALVDKRVEGGEAPPPADESGDEPAAEAAEPTVDAAADAATEVDAEADAAAPSEDALPEEAGDAPSEDALPEESADAEPAPTPEAD